MLQWGQDVLQSRAALEKMKLLEHESDVLVPDRRPGTGPLSTPSTATASAFRPVGQAVNVLNGANIASLVIELPTSQLTAGGNAKIGLWGTISR